MATTEMLPANDTGVSDDSAVETTTLPAAVAPSVETLHTILYIVIGEWTHLFHVGCRTFHSGGVAVIEQMNNSTVSLRRVFTWHQMCPMPHLGSPISTEWIDLAFFVFISGVVGLVGNGFTLMILCSSSTLRRKIFNMFLISQSCLDGISAALLIATAWDLVFFWKPGHHGVLGGKIALLVPSISCGGGQFLSASNEILICQNALQCDVLTQVF